MKSGKVMLHNSPGKIKQNGHPSHSTVLKRKKRRSKVTMPPKKRLAKREDKPCFVCNAEIEGGVSVHSLTKAHRVSMYQKLTKIATSGDVVFLIDDDGVICNVCQKLINYLDRLEAEETIIGNIVKNTIYNKYQVFSETVNKSQLDLLTLDAIKVTKGEIIKEVTEDKTVRKEEEDITQDEEFLKQARTALNSKYSTASDGNNFISLSDTEEYENSVMSPKTITSKTKQNIKGSVRGKEELPVSDNETYIQVIKSVKREPTGKNTKKKNSNLIKVVNPIEKIHEKQTKPSDSNTDSNYAFNDETSNIDAQVTAPPRYKKHQAVSKSFSLKGKSITSPKFSKPNIKVSAVNKGPIKKFKASGLKNKRTVVKSKAKGKKIFTPTSVKHKQEFKTESKLKKKVIGGSLNKRTRKELKSSDSEDEYPEEIDTHQNITSENIARDTAKFSAEVQGASALKANDVDQHNFECRLCSFETKFKSIMIFHLRMHLNSDDLRCDFCNIFLKKKMENTKISLKKDYHRDIKNLEEALSETCNTFLEDTKRDKRAGNDYGQLDVSSESEETESDKNPSDISVGKNKRVSAVKKQTAGELKTEQNRAVPADLATNKSTTIKKKQFSSEISKGNDEITKTSQEEILNKKFTSDDSTLIVETAKKRRVKQGVSSKQTPNNKLIALKRELSIDMNFPIIARSPSAKRRKVQSSQTKVNSHIESKTSSKTKKKRPISGILLKKNIQKHSAGTKVVSIKKKIVVPVNAQKSVTNKDLKSMAKIKQKINALVAREKSLLKTSTERKTISGIKSSKLTPGVKASIGLKSKETLKVGKVKKSQSGNVVKKTNVSVIKKKSGTCVTKYPNSSTHKLKVNSTKSESPLVDEPIKESIMMKALKDLSTRIPRVFLRRL